MVGAGIESPPGGRLWLLPESDQQNLDLPLVSCSSNCRQVVGCPAGAGQLPVLSDGSLLRLLKVGLHDRPGSIMQLAVAEAVGVAFDRLRQQVRISVSVAIN